MLGGMIVGEIMDFPENPMDFIKDYQRHTNGSDLIPVYRVKQMLEHYGIKKTDHNGWISCSDKPPKESNYYLAYIYNEVVDDFDIRKTWFAHTDDYDIEESEWRELYKYEKVTAWMPLPEPYSQGEKGEKMKRLTESDEQGNFWLKDVPWKFLYAGKIITIDTSEKIYGALCKLKDYEETGLTPDQVQRLKKLDTRKKALPIWIRKFTCRFKKR